MVIDELLDVLPAPQDPVESGRGEQWPAVHDRIGVLLPRDYADFITHYGTGCVSGWLSVYNPFSENPNLNLFRRIAADLSGLRDLKASAPRTVPFPLYFEPGGLLPWGTSIDGDIFCWLTSGLEGVWKVAVICRHDDPEVHSVSMSQFISRACTRALASRAFPADIVSDAGPEFVPYRRAG